MKVSEGGKRSDSRSIEEVGTQNSVNDFNGRRTRGSIKDVIVLLGQLQWSPSAVRGGVGGDSGNTDNPVRTHV